MLESSISPMEFISIIIHHPLFLFDDEFIAERGNHTVDAGMDTRAEFPFRNIPDDISCLHLTSHFHDRNSRRSDVLGQWYSNFLRRKFHFSKMCRNVILFHAKFSDKLFQRDMPAIINWVRLHFTVAFPFHS